ncbi:multidrug efflux system membrane fusion protein [Rhizobium petrolearium]|uniref:efflux RND transporter periplasmic adaptor subunit n=1 Tax=Neorhizobium petrolearium TaxID=515361 RepID=UPI001AE6B97C|nr:efflux RND transporter periplasmic adaptor subunit [Neorhizobium petrolearium]MBP1846712.1 multidrug efflux system membrane fusion protein [Neorhizobium petrolearium]
MTSKIKNWALWGTGLGTAALIAGASVYLDIPQGANAAPATAAAAAPAVPVTVATIEPRNVTTWQEFSGRLEAVDRVQIRPRVAGTIQAVHFREGGLVKAGDLLVTIDPEPYEAAVAQAEGQVASAEARVQLATTELERGKTLAANNTISQSDLAQRQSTKGEALANLQSAKAELRVAELNLGYTEIRAPISGRVGRLEITVGNLVASGSESAPLTTLVSADPIYASFDASEELVTRILAQLPAQNGAPAIEQVPVEVSTLADGGAPIRGKLQLIDNEVNALSGTIRVRAVFDNPGGRLIPGQFVRVRMGQPKSEDRLMVSEKAVGTDQDKKFVFVVDANNTVAYRQVELGSAVDGLRIVEKGLNPGDRIVVNGLQRIRPGAVVEPQDEAKVATK